MTVPSVQGAIAIIAALPRELALLSRGLGARRVRDRDGTLLQIASPGGDPATPAGDAGDILLVTAGMGAHRVSLAVAAALAHGPVRMLVSVGLAGACDPGLDPGTVLEATEIVDINSGERFRPEAPLGVAAPGILVTTPEIASPAEKRRLRASYNASVVDMEAATVARLARAHGIPVRAIKAISDEHDLDLSHLSAFTTMRGEFRTGTFALHTALRPHRWRRTAVLGRNTNLALKELTRAMQQMIASARPGHPSA